MIALRVAVLLFLLVSAASPNEPAASTETPADVDLVELAKHRKFGQAKPSSPHLMLGPSP